MVQPATTTSVKGDFTQHRITLHGAPYGLREANGAFYITESYLTGKPQEHRVDYTLGNRRIQHYLTTLPDGRIILLQPSWDVQRKDWFHNLDVADPANAPGVQVQLWNKSCFSCHVSQQEKNFNPVSNEYKTKWLNFGTNCERCHGPGSEHIQAGLKTNIVLQTRLDPERNTMVCAQCHSFRDIFVKGYSAGANYFDYFMPILDYSLQDEEDRNYWADGRTRRFSNDAFGFWQSECFLKGKATCVACHVNAHETEIEKNPQLRPDANVLCTRCHAAEGKAGSAHTHHSVASAGSSCVECHMPRSVYSIKAEIRDHAMSIPVPENTVNHGIPNACNLCHKDRDAEWTLRAFNTWYGKDSRQKWIRRADTFALARTGDAAAIPGLLAILTEPREGPLARANAAGYLGAKFSSDSRVSAAMLWALTDEHPLVRATAALRMNPAHGDRAAMLAALTHALSDASATVRLSAAVTLVSAGVKQLSGQDGERLKSAEVLFRERALHNSDDSAQQVAAGRFYYLTGEFASAVEAFQASLKLDPDAPAEYLLAAAYASQGQLAKAREVLETIPPADGQYEKAQRLLKAIAAEQAK
jgi:predicted CXXCH cytochrome family protein